MPYKIKSSNLEDQISKLEVNMKKCEETVELHKTNIDALEKLNKEKKIKIYQVYIQRNGKSKFQSINQT